MTGEVTGSDLGFRQALLVCRAIQQINVAECQVNDISWNETNDNAEYETNDNA